MILLIKYLISFRMRSQ